MHTQINEDVDRSCDALWSNVFLPSYKSRLFSSVAVSEKNHAIAEVSEFATGMVLLAMDRKSSPSPTPADVNFDSLFRYFATSSVVPPPLSCRFMLNFLQVCTDNFIIPQNNVDTIIRVTILKLFKGPRDTVARVRAALNGTMAPLISGWVRCSFVLTPNTESLENLSEAIFSLEEMAELQEERSAINATIQVSTCTVHIIPCILLSP